MGRKEDGARFFSVMHIDRQQAQPRAREIPLKHKGKIIQDQTTEQAAQKCWGISILGDIPKPRVHILPWFQQWAWTGDLPRSFPAPLSCGSVHPNHSQGMVRHLRQVSQAFQSHLISDGQRGHTQANKAQGRLELRNSSVPHDSLIKGN